MELRERLSGMKTTENGFRDLEETVQSVFTAYESSCDKSPE